jgi:hypothetical protein
MSPDLRSMIDRVTRLCDGLAGRSPSSALMAEIDDVLTEGYARALNGDSWSTRTEERLHELISNPAAPVRARHLRAVATDHAAFQRELIELRRRLAELRAARDRLRAGVAMRSS